MKYTNLIIFFPMQWLTVKELEKLKGGPGLIASVKKKER